MEAPNTTELNLDALCDLLDDDEDELAAFAEEADELNQTVWI